MHSLSSIFKLKANFIHRQYSPVKVNEGYKDHSALSTWLQIFSRLSILAEKNWQQYEFFKYFLNIRLNYSISEMRLPHATELVLSSGDWQGCSRMNLLSLRKK